MIPRSRRGHSAPGVWERWWRHISLCWKEVLEVGVDKHKVRTVWATHMLPWRVVLKRWLNNISTFSQYNSVILIIILSNIFYKNDCRTYLWCNETGGKVEHIIFKRICERLRTDMYVKERYRVMKQPCNSYRKLYNTFNCKTKVRVKRAKTHWGIEGLTWGIEFYCETEGNPAEPQPEWTTL